MQGCSPAGRQSGLSLPWSGVLFRCTAGLGMAGDGSLNSAPPRAWAPLHIQTTVWKGTKDRMEALLPGISLGPLGVCGVV